MAGVGVGVRAQDDGGSNSERAEEERRVTRHAAHRARVEYQGVRIIIGPCRGVSMGPAGLFDGFDGCCRVGE